MRCGILEVKPHLLRWISQESTIGCSLINFLQRQTSAFSYAFMGLQLVGGGCLQNNQSGIVGIDCMSTNDLRRIGVYSHLLVFLTMCKSATSWYTMHYDGWPTFHDLLFRFWSNENCAEETTTRRNNEFNATGDMDGFLKEVNSVKTSKRWVVTNLDVTVGLCRNTRYTTRSYGRRL